MEELYKLDNDDNVYDYYTMCKFITQNNKYYYVVNVAENILISEIGYDDYYDEVHTYNFRCTEYEIVDKKYIWSDENICYDIISYNPTLINFVENKTTKILVKSYIKMNIPLSTIENVTFDICNEFIEQQYNFNFHEINKNLLTFDEYYQLCKNFIKKSHNNIGKLPIDFLSENMGLCYYATDYYNYSILQYIPEHLRTYELCFCEIKKKSESLEYVPEHLKTYEICEYAIRHENTKYFHENPTIAYVSEELLTYELCEYAIINQINSPSNNNVIKWIPKTILTYDLCILSMLYMVGVNNKQSVIDLIPGEMLTHELCMLYLLNPKANIKGKLKHIPRKFITEEMLLIVTKINPCEIKFIETEFQSVNVCWNALNITKCKYTLDHIVNPSDEMKLYFDNLNKTQELKNCGCTCEKPIGGLMSLIAYGTQDVYLSGSPNINYFKPNHNEFETLLFMEYMKNIKFENNSLYKYIKIKQEYLMKMILDGV